MGDSGTYIFQSADGVLDLVSDTEIEINATTIDINGNAEVSGTLTIAGNLVFGSATVTEAQLEILDGATVTTDELNLIDGGTARGTTAVASGDGILINDAGTMRMTNVDTVSTYFSSHSVGGSNIVSATTLEGVLIRDGGFEIPNSNTLHWDIRDSLLNEVTTQTSAEGTSCFYNQLALLDNKIDTDEHILLKRLASRLDITKSEFDEILKNPENLPKSSLRHISRPIQYDWCTLVPLFLKNIKNITILKIYIEMSRLESLLLK